MSAEGTRDRLEAAEDLDRPLALTHGHADHIGLAERLRVEAGARVLVHEADQALARTGVEPSRERGALPYLWRPAAIRLGVGSPSATSSNSRASARAGTGSAGTP